MRSKTTLISILAMGIIFLIGAGIASRPYLLALYHQRQGGIHLDLVMHAESGDQDKIYACEFNTITSPDNREHLRIAIAHLEAAEHYKSEHMQTYLQLGRAYCLLGETDQAIKNYEDFVERNSENPLGYVELAIALERQWYESEGYSNLLVAGLNPDTFIYPEGVSKKRIINAWQDAGVKVQDFISAGEQMLEIKQYNDALLWAYRAILFAPTGLQPWFLIGEVFQSQSRWDDAIRVYEYLSRISPENRQIWYELGSVYKAKSDWMSALDAYQQGLIAEAGRVGLSNLYYWIGYILQLKVSFPDIDAAWSAYLKALELDDYQIDYWQKASTYYQRGQILAKEGKWNEAIQEYKQAMVLRPDFYFAYVEIARSYWSNNSERTAIAELTKAIKIDPDRKAAYLLLGEIFLSKGEKHKAKATYQKVLELDPNDQQALQKMSELENNSPMP